MNFFYNWIFTCMTDDNLMSQFIRVVFGLCCIYSTYILAEPQNVGLLKHEVSEYYHSGAYQSDLNKQITKAEQDILALAHRHPKELREHHLAIVLDIDETSLSNANSILARDYAGMFKLIHNDIMKANAPAIKPMLKLYNDAQKQGIKVFFVTGRFVSERQATIKNLKKAGYRNWSGLYLRPENYNAKSIIPFKSQARAKITQKGYLILASIGDQYSDIKGGYAQKGYKLVNPFYYVP